MLVEFVVRRCRLGPNHSYIEVLALIGRTGGLIGVFRGGDGRPHQQLRLQKWVSEHLTPGEVIVEIIELRGELP